MRGELFELKYILQYYTTNQNSKDVILRIRPFISSIPHPLFPLPRGKLTTFSPFSPSPSYTKRKRRIDQFLFSAPLVTQNMGNGGGGLISFSPEKKCGITLLPIDSYHNKGGKGSGGGFQSKRCWAVTSGASTSRFPYLDSKRRNNQSHFFFPPLQVCRTSAKKTV